MTKTNGLIETCKNLLTCNLAVKDGETVLIVTDDVKQSIAELFVKAGRELGVETVLMSMKERIKSGEEPPAVIHYAMGMADVVLCVTEHSLTHTDARKNAASNGARVATLPGITLDMLKEGAITANYEEVRQLTERVTSLLDTAEEVVVEKEGKALTFSVKGRNGINSTGMFTKKSESGNLPSGESYIAPVEYTATGSIIVDGSVAGLGVLTEPIQLELAEGKIVGANGSPAGELLEILGSGDGRLLCEFGIGTNKCAHVIGNVLEDEKVYGTIHLAFGSNHTFGGTINAGVHIDCVIHYPTVYLDGTLIMREGELV